MNDVESLQRHALHISDLHIHRFEHNIAMLDGLISCFGLKSAYSPVRGIRFSGGVSSYVRASTKIMGGFEAYRQLPMMYQLMFCIGEYGKHLPDGKEWMNKALEKVANKEAYELILDPTEVITSSMASMFECCMMYNSHIMGYDELETFSYLISNAQYHFLRLGMLRKVLLASTNAGAGENKTVILVLYSYAT